jgi:formimidoylglutamate deiminase
MLREYQPDLLFRQGEFRPGSSLLVDEDGRVAAPPATPPDSPREVVRLPGKALLPSFVNAHSHTFQRLIRGYSEHRGTNGDDFWSWREAMYRAALSVDAGDLYHVARMAFLEMALAGTTAVGEFHYLHRAQDGTAYLDPNHLGRQIVAAAQSVGIRIALLRVAYMRAGFELPPSAGQRRFYESEAEFLANAASLAQELSGSPHTAWLGIAPHSIRAVPLDSLRSIVAWAGQRGLPVHMHVAEQPAELAASVREHGATPVALLAREGLLSERSTLVHGIHVTPQELDAIAAAGATICSCPTTERNLGDGIIAAEEAAARGIAFAFGSDSQTLIHPLEDARELEYHLRLRDIERVRLDAIAGQDMSQRLFQYASAGGARSIGLRGGHLAPGEFADFFTLDLNHVSIAGVPAEELLPAFLFSGSLEAIRDVAVAGNWIVNDGAHEAQREIVARYAEVSRRVWRA